MDITRHRHPLLRTRQAIAAGALTVGYIGGSITDARPGHNWPEPVTAWLVDRFPTVRLRVENAAIGATGSQLAAFRARRDLIDRDCHLVFMEYAVNDYGVASDARRRSREGLIRQLLEAGLDVVLVYTFSHPMYADMREGRVPASIAEFEELGEHYQLGSVWMGLHALREVERGLMKWDDWLPDGLHPTQRGSLSYAQAVIAYLEAELAEPPPAGRSGARQALPSPRHPQHWQHPQRVDFARVERRGPWREERATTLTWVDTWLYTTAPGATLAFRFEGRELVLALDFGRNHADFRCRIDGGDWQMQALDRPDWAGPRGWLRLVTVATDLAPACHDVELEVLQPGPGPGVAPNFRVAFIGFV